MLYSEEQEHQYVAELSALTGATWEWEHTGGGCTAVVLHVDGGIGSEEHYLMVTHSEDASIPSENDPHTLGEYLDHGDSPNWWYFPSRAAMVEFLKLWLSHRYNG